MQNKTNPRLCLREGVPATEEPTPPTSTPAPCEVEGVRQVFPPSSPAPGGPPTRVLLGARTQDLKSKGSSAGPAKAREDRCLASRWREGSPLNARSGSAFVSGEEVACCRPRARSPPAIFLAFFPLRPTPSFSS